MRSSVSIECFVSGSLETNTYVLCFNESAVVIDPAEGCETAVFRFIHDKKYTIQAIWITHSHLDHISGCGNILKRHTVPIAVHFLDAENLKKPGSDLLPVWIECQPVEPSILFGNKTVLRCGDSVWQVIHTPGHTPGSSCFYSAEEKILISGDTLFRGTCGRCSFPTSDPRLMRDSLFELSSLPEETVVFPGHGQKTSIAREKGWMVNFGS